MNPVLILTHNNLELTKRAIESVVKQDIPPSLRIVDNGSSDGTLNWLVENNVIISSAFIKNAGVSIGWNAGIESLMKQGFSHVLVIGNDTVLAPWTYRKLLACDVPFVTGIAVDQMSQIEQEPPDGLGLSQHPDFSCFLIRRDCWQKVGPFDERMKLYASDCDFHVRAHRLGIPLYKACVPYYHERSSTLRNAPPREQKEIQMQANLDRQVFRSIYGCIPGDPEYAELFRQSPECIQSSDSAPAPESCGTVSETDRGDCRKSKD